MSRKIKEIADLMTDESNVDEVMKGSIELEKTFKKFKMRTKHCSLVTE